MNVSAKAEAAKELFSGGKNSREVAKELGYKDASGLSAMMRRQGYKWDSKVKNYVYSGDNGEVSGNGATDIVDVLNGKVEQLESMLDWFEKTRGAPGEPRMRRVSGPTVTKGFRLPVEVDERLNSFCNRLVLHQKDVLITALLEFLDQYE